MDYKSGQKRALVILISFLVGFLVLVFFAVIPLNKKVYQQKDSLEEAKLILRRDQENIDKYMKDLDYLKDNYFLSEGLEIDEKSRVKLIEDIEKVAKEQSLKMGIETYNQVVNKDKKAKKENPKTVLKVDLQGDYRGFMNFIYKLQNFKYAVSIDKLTVENFDDSQIKNLKEEVSIEDLPEIEGEIIISFN